MANEILNPKTAAWPAMLAGSSVLGSFALACVFPFAAFAALAATTMRLRTGLALVTSAWAANQLVGFFVLSFPWDAQAVGHGISILAASLIAFGAARMTGGKIVGNPVLRGSAALVSAFIVFQILLRAYAQFGGGAENFSFEIIRDVAINDGLWFAGLMAAHFALTRLTGRTALAAAA
jgi:hypothetical protein